MSTSTGSVYLFKPVRTVSEANTGGRFRDKLKRKREQRMVFAFCLKSIGSLVQYPCTIKLTRHSTGHQLLDDDNLRSALKACRDGVAEALGKDDGARSGITWEYGQKNRAGEYGVGVEIRW
jgi:hypothetical protein